MYRTLFILFFLLASGHSQAGCPPPKCDPPLLTVWPRSEYPLVLAPNGCDYIGGLMGDKSLGIVDFTPACNNHDRCYFTLGASSTQCNDRFLKEMVALCREAHPGAPTSQAFIKCRGGAETIAGMVALAAPIAFYNAQKSAYDYHKWIQQHCTLAPGCE